MRKNILYISLAIALVLMSCTDEDAIRIPDLQHGAVPDFEIMEGTDEVIPANDPSSWNTTFTIDMVTKTSVRSANLYVSYNDSDTVLIENVSAFPKQYTYDLQSLLELYPDKTVDEIVGGDKVVFFIDEIELTDGRVLKNDYELFIQDTTATGNDTILEVNAPGLNQSTASLTFWSYTAIYYVTCPESLTGRLAGTYSVVTNGTSTDGQPAAVDLEGEVTLTSQGVGIYTLDDVFAGAYEYWYCAPYGYCFKTPGNIIEVCGTISGTWSDGFGATSNVDGSYDESTGVITIHWINDFGDEATSVYTPIN